MYLHLGADIVVKTSNVLGIFDIEKTSISKITKAYLSNAQKSNFVVNVTEELPKSFVVCSEKDKTVVYISQISPSTLTKRTNFIKNISNIN